MTAKEKANELVDKFYQTTPNESWINEPLGIAEPYGSWKQAKECALITVDETLWVLNELDHDLPDDDAILFYSEVKQEIEKL